MSAKEVPRFDVHGVCALGCGRPKYLHKKWLSGNFTNYECPLPPETPPKSKAVLFDVFKPCRKCTVKKYINAETKLCLACHGMP